MTIHELKILPEYFKAQKTGYVVLGTKYIKELNNEN